MSSQLIKHKSEGKRKETSLWSDRGTVKTLDDGPTQSNKVKLT